MKWFQNAQALSYLALMFYILAFWGRWERRRRVGGGKDRPLQTVNKDETGQKTRVEERARDNDYRVLIVKE